MKKPRQPRKESCPHCPMPRCPNCPLMWDPEMSEKDDTSKEDSLLNEYGPGVPKMNFPNDFS